MSPRAPTPCCCSTGQDGTRQASSTCPKTSRRSSCRPAPRSSTRSRTSGNICARTGSQTPYSKTTTRSSAPHAPRGEISSLSPKQSPPSQCATGLTSVSHYDPWYYALGKWWRLEREPVFEKFGGLATGSVFSALLVSYVAYQAVGLKSTYSQFEGEQDLLLKDVA